jgi:uncharacterized RDD family membrane protein YckC
MEVLYYAQSWIHIILSIVGIAILCTYRVRGKGFLLAYLSLGVFVNLGWFVMNFMFANELVKFDHAVVEVFRMGLSLLGFLLTPLLLGFIIVLRPPRGVSQEIADALLVPEQEVPAWRPAGGAQDTSGYEWARGRSAPEPAENPYRTPEAPHGFPAPPVLELAGCGERLAAAIFDSILGVLAALPGIVLIIAALNTSRREEDVIPGIIVLALGILGITAYQWYLLAVAGQTIGKRILRIRVARHPDGANPGFGRAVGLRIIVSGLPAAIPIIGSLYGLADVLLIFGEPRRCIHDYIASTVVVKA